MISNSNNNVFNKRSLSAIEFQRFIIIFFFLPFFFFAYNTVHCTVRVKKKTRQKLELCKQDKIKTRFFYDDDFTRKTRVFIVLIAVFSFSLCWLDMYAIILHTHCRETRHQLIYGIKTITRHAGFESKSPTTVRIERYRDMYDLSSSYVDRRLYTLFTVVTWSHMVIRMQACD